MSRTILAACAGLALASLTAAAQTPPTSSQPQISAPMPAPSDLTTMTVTGCLKPWNAAMTDAGTTTPEAGAPSVGSRDPQYVLTDVDDSSRKPASSATTPSNTQPRSTASSMSHAMYLLKAKDSSVNLSQHVNHKVQVTGSVLSDSSLRMPSTTGQTTSIPKPIDPSTTSRDTSSAAGKPATLTVSALTMVSSSCATTSR
jgi:hypothetical protein